MDITPKLAHAAGKGTTLYVARKYECKRSCSSGGRDRFSCGAARSSSSSCSTTVKRACRQHHVRTLSLAFFLSCFFMLAQELLYWDSDWPPQLLLRPSTTSSFSAAAGGLSRFSFVDALLQDAFHVDLTLSKAGGGGGECDYSTGTWVRTRRRPLYSGRDCQRWLSPMWACRLDANRSSFLYESLRWQPFSCNLPPFHPPSFLHRMRNKSIAFIGDSLGRQQFQSLMCLLTRGRDDDDNVIDIGAEFGFPSYVKASKLNNTKTFRPSSWAFLFKKTNTKIIFSWSPTLCHLEPIMSLEGNLSDNIEPLNNSSYMDQLPEVAFHADRPPTFLSFNLHQFDVVILNTGPHWNINKFAKNNWRIHIAEKPLTIEMTADSINKLYNYTIFNLVEWLNMQVEMGATVAKIFYRTLSPHHFFRGEWNSGGHCDNTHYRFMDSIGMRKVSKGLQEEIKLENFGHVQLLNVTWMSQLRDEAHISKYTLKPKNGSQDCLHWCLPGVPDAWNEMMYAQLLQHSAKQGKRALY